MNCREFEADVVDLARGAEAGATASLREHLEQCDGCAARLARERQLTSALKAVADSVPPSPRASAIEEQLLRVFEAQHATAIPRVPAPDTRLTRHAAMGWLAAAAVVVLAVAAWQGVARWRSESGVTPTSTQAAARPAGPVPETFGQTVGASTPGLAATPATAVPPERPARARLEPAGVSRLSTPDPSTPRVAQTRGSDVLRFVALPTAIGLPPIESGHIVRVELPAAMLPAYGLEVVPDSQSGMVEADVLVGQDGQPRAIRFVTLDSDSRRRQ